MILVLVEFKPDVEGLAEDLGILASVSKRHKGCLAYIPTTRWDDDESIILVENWETQADLREHLESEPVKEFFGKFEKHLARDPQIIDVEAGAIDIRTAA